MKVTVDDYDRLVKWVKTGYGYFEEFGLPNMPEQQREKAKKFLAAALPLLAAARQGQPRNAHPGPGRRPIWPW